MRRAANEGRIILFIHSDTLRISHNEAKPIYPAAVEVAHACSSCQIERASVSSVKGF